MFLWNLTELQLRELTSSKQVDKDLGRLLAGVQSVGCRVTSEGWAKTGTLTTKGQSHNLILFRV